MSLLALEALEVAYGGIRAVKGIDLAVEAGEMVCLIGANGAGKTTTLRAVTGLVPAAGGRVALRRCGHLAASRRTRSSRRGIALVPEGRGVFPQLTVEENLAMGAYARSERAAVRADEERVYAPLPAPEGAPAADRGHAVRRRAADARHGARPHEPAAACCCSTSPAWASRRSWWRRSSR